MQSHNALLHREMLQCGCYDDAVPKTVDVVQGRSGVPTSSYLNAKILFSMTVLVTGMGFGGNSALITLMASKEAMSVQHSNLVTSLFQRAFFSPAAEAAIQDNAVYSKKDLSNTLACPLGNICHEDNSFI